MKLVVHLSDFGWPVPTDQLGPAVGVSWVVQLAPLTVWPGPLVARWSSFTSCVSNAEVVAPLSTTNAYGPCPATQTGASAIAACPCLTTWSWTRLTAPAPAAGWLTAGQRPGKIGWLASDADPAPPQVSGATQPPHTTTLLQPSETAPHDAPSCAQVLGVHGGMPHRLGRSACILAACR